MTTGLRIGCTLPTNGAAADPGALGALAQAAEDLGFDAVWLSDHIVVPERIASSYPYATDGRFPTPARMPYLEPLVSLAYVAGLTKRVRLGTHVLVLPYRHPLLTAKMIATLDNLSGGRVDLGIGVGWMREEFEALGQTTYDQRGAASDEQLRILDAVWSNDVASFQGQFYPFESVGAHPQPIQKPHPPIWVGGHTRPALRRTARFGDGWLPIGARPPAHLPPEELAGMIDFIRTEAATCGRDPQAIRTYFSTHVAVLDGPPDEPRPFSGTPETIAADFERYMAVGVEGFVIGLGPVPPAEYEHRLRRFAEQVRPALAGAATAPGHLSP